jgi:serine/threonine protein kinase
VLQGRYFLGVVLGQGGFGITYRGRDLKANAPVAVKEYLPSSLAARSQGSRTIVPHSERDGDHFGRGLVRFREEAQALASFHHPAIVNILGYFETNGTGYLVMPYLEGKTLRGFLEDKGGRIPFPLALAILVPVMDALRKLHARSLLHRDVSPENIYLTLDRHVILLDFGAARYAVSESTKSLTVVLKPGFAPIEQYFGRHQGPHTDIYALAATLYFACTGEVPAPAPSRLERDELVPPRRLGVEIPARAEAALLRALAVEAERRYASVQEFQRELVAAERDSAPPMSEPNPVVPWWRRHLVWAAVLAALVACLIVGWALM